MLSDFLTDFNTAKSQSNLIPKGTTVKVKMAIKPGGYENWFAESYTTGSIYLNAEFTVTEGPYTKRKIYQVIGIKSGKASVEGEDTYPFSYCLSKYEQVIQLFSHCLKDAANGLFALKNALSENEISISKFTKQAKELRRYIQYCMIKISYILEAKGASRTVKGIIRSEPMMWTFLDDPRNIPLTNNHVERQIRHYVVYRKNSYFAQSERGNRFLERIISLYLTWRQKELNPFHNLLSIVS